MRTTYCGLVSEALMGQTVTLMGWAHRRRDHGGVIFIDLRDREGLVQVVCDPDRAATFAVAEEVRNEFCLKVTGLVRARPSGTDNTSLTSGKVEVLCHELEVLNPSGNVDLYISTSRFQPPSEQFNLARSENPGAAPEFIAVYTNGTPPLVPGLHYYTVIIQ